MHILLVIEFRKVASCFYKTFRKALKCKINLKVGKYIFNVTRLNEGSLGKGLFFHETRPKKSLDSLAGKINLNWPYIPALPQWPKFKFNFPAK